MESLFNGMLPIALQNGISVFDYWSMTYGEIVDTIKALNEREMNRIREQAGHNYQLANLIGLSVARLLDKNAKFPSLYEAYPNLFEEPIEKVTPQQDWRIAKDRLIKYTEQHNKKRGGTIE